MKFLLGILLTGLAVTHEAAAQRFAQVDNYLLKELPSWSHDTLYDGIYVDVEKAMKELKLSRLEAIELQNQVKDSVLQNPKVSKQTAFVEALQNIRVGQLESTWRPVSFSKPGEFVAVLDMDETLLVQWYGSGTKGFFDFKISPDVVGSTFSYPYVKVTPRAEEFLRRLKASPLCKGIVAFSAKADKQALEIYRTWKLSDGESVSTLISHIMTRNHLILQKKVLIPSKDLRLFDEKLEHVVLVDDNPARVFQQHNLKAQPKFDADQYHEALEKKDRPVIEYYEKILEVAADEILEAAEYAQEKKIPFSRAYEPYSQAGERVYRTFLKLLVSEERAKEATRANPELQEAGFVVDQSRR